MYIWAKKASVASKAQSLYFCIPQNTSAYCIYKYLEYHSVYPLVRIGTPRPLSRMRVGPPPGTEGGGDTLVCGW